MRNLIIILITLLSTYPNVGLSDNIHSSSYDDSPTIQKVHQLLFALCPVTLSKILNEEELRNPQNGYIPFYRLYQETILLFISGSPDQFQNKLERLNQLQQTLSQLPEGFPEYRHLNGEGKLFIGLLKIKYQSKLSGIFDCLKGYRLLKENHEIYPHYQADLKFPAMIQISVAFMPGVIRWAIRILGIPSRPMDGLKMLTQYGAFAKSRPGYEEEYIMIQLAAHKLMNQDDKATDLLRSKNNLIQNTPLLSYFAATVYLETNQSEAALSYLGFIPEKKLEIEFLAKDYLKGKALLYQLSPEAYHVLTSFLNQSSSIDFRKAALFERACISFVLGDSIGYQNDLVKIKDEGRALHNRDIEAAYEAEKGGWPNLNLMKAELLMKGGNCQRAIEELNRLKSGPFKEPEFIQYYWINAECLRIENSLDQALDNYQHVINLGEPTENYKVQQAYNEMGKIHESRGERAKAEESFKLALKFKTQPNPYSELCINKAKAGLLRLSLFPE